MHRIVEWAINAECEQALRLGETTQCHIEAGGTSRDGLCCPTAQRLMCSICDEGGGRLWIGRQQYRRCRIERSICQTYGMSFFRDLNSRTSGLCHTLCPCLLCDLPQAIHQRLPATIQVAHLGIQDG